MTGRGFLKKRLAQLNKETDEQPTPSEEPHDDIKHVIPVVSTETLVSGHQQVVRGRRVNIIIFIILIIKNFF